jgi:hypothetical protein
MQLFYSLASGNLPVTEPALPLPSNEPAAPAFALDREADAVLIEGRERQACRPADVGASMPGRAR